MRTPGLGPSPCSRAKCRCGSPTLGVPPTLRACSLGTARSASCFRGAGTVGIQMQEVRRVLFHFGSFLQPSAAAWTRPFPSDCGPACPPSASRLCWPGILCAHPRLIKVLGRTQWSLQPGRTDNWPHFDVSQVQNGPRPPGPALHACLFLSLCRPFRFPLPKWGSHHYCCHYPIGNVAKRALPLHPAPPSKDGGRPPTMSDLPSI